MEPCTDDDLLPATQQDDPCEEDKDRPNGSHSNAWGRLLGCGPHLQPVELEGQEILLGRNAQCSFTYSDPRISGRHCRLFRSHTSPTGKLVYLGGGEGEISASQEEACPGGHVYIEDLSTNGTFINGKKLGQGNLTLLQNGDKIDLILERSNSDLISYMFQDLSLQQRPVEEADQSELFNHYDVRNVLGRGNFSEVFLGVNKRTGERVAIKRLDKARVRGIKNGTQQLMREVDILTKVEHENIVQVKDIFDGQRYFYIVLELATGGELFERIADHGRLEESEARKVFIQLLDAVGYLHSKGIVHRDIKPENILFANNSRRSPRVKITDFGLARLFGEQELMKTLCGTPHYVAPEIVLQTTSDTLTSNTKYKGYGKEVDVWSLGVILYLILSGMLPFDDDEQCELTLFEQIMEGIFGFEDPVWNTISFSAKHLIQSLMALNPKDRLTIEQAKAHPWIQQQQQKEAEDEKQLSWMEEQTMDEEERQVLEEEEEEEAQAFLFFPPLSRTSGDAKKEEKRETRNAKETEKEEEEGKEKEKEEVVLIDITKMDEEERKNHTTTRKTKKKQQRDLSDILKLPPKEKKPSERRRRNNTYSTSASSSTSTLSSSSSSSSSSVQTKKRKLYDRDANIEYINMKQKEEETTKNDEDKEQNETYGRMNFILPTTTTNDENLSMSNSNKIRRVSTPTTKAKEETKKAISSSASVRLLRTKKEEQSETKTTKRTTSSAAVRSSGARVSGLRRSAKKPTALMVVSSS
ncbi:MlkA protein [Balamuthia mandrillaris]